MYHHQPDDTETKAFMQAFVNGEINNNEAEPIYKPLKAPQITRVGSILRKSSLDELPQLFNVLKGDMSLVGPRPNMPCEVDVYKDWHKQRLQTLPGITGLAQINGAASPFDRIVKYDLLYRDSAC
jgi:lipopolysaccharide/colanic/teichoic acid biosynthesis glycosyltransferase